MPTIIAIALLSITGLLGAFLYIGQSRTTDAAVVAQQQQQRCDKARFDLRYDTALTSASPMAAADARRVETECAKATELRDKADQASREQQSSLDRIENSIGAAIRGDSK
jgi:hypothetical protein